MQLLILGSMVEVLERVGSGAMQYPSGKRLIPRIINSPRKPMEILTIGVRFTESMIHAGRFTSLRTVVVSRRSGNNTRKRRTTPMMTLTTRTRMTTSPDGILLFSSPFIGKSLIVNEGYAR